MILRSHAQLHSRGYDERQRNDQMAMSLAVVSDGALAVVFVCVPAPDSPPNQHYRRRQPNALGGLLSDFWDDKAQENLAVRRHQPSQQVAAAKFSRRTPADPAGPPRLVPRTLRAGLARLPLGGRTEDAGVRELSDRPLTPPRRIWPACGAADGAATMACGPRIAFSQPAAACYHCRHDQAQDEAAQLHAVA